jgi:hypothetical protein
MLASGAVALCGCAAAGAWAWWPELLEDTVQQKVEDTLGRRFDQVQMGCFHLRRDSIRVCDLVLTKGDARVEIDELEIEFDADWGAVTVDSISARGGLIAGGLESFEELREDRGAGSRPSNSRIHLEDVELMAEGIVIDGTARGHKVKAIVWNVSADGLDGIISLTLDDLEIRKGEALVAFARVLDTEVDPQQPFPLAVYLRDAKAPLARDLVVSDVGGTLTFADKEITSVHADLVGHTAEGQSWAFLGDADRTTGTISASLTAKDLRPWQIPGSESLPLAEEEGRISVDLEVSGTSRQLRVAGTAHLNGVFLDHPRIAPDPVRLDLELELRGLEVDVDSQSLVLERASIYPLLEGHRRPGLAVELSGELSNASDPALRQFEVRAVTAPSSCQGLLEAIPPGLAPGLEGFVLEGNTSLDLEVTVDMTDPEATVLEGGLDLDRCRIKRVPPKVAELAGPFNHVVRMKDGRTTSRFMGMGSPYFASIDELPIHVHAAVVATEDGGFWHHDGFLEKQIKASLKRNVETGEFKRGGSTITMQMVKNVLLSHEKTLSRKLQELLLTWVVEEQLSKDRIMELYLNAVEFGPGIYGIGHAAQHYFDKSALELNSLESAFLATLLPRPVERHEMWCRGAVTEKHLSYVHKIHLRMLAKHAVSQEEFDLAEQQGIVFGRTQWHGEGECLSAGRAVEDGGHVQGAVNGLLFERVEF